MDLAEGMACGAMGDDDIAVLNQDADKWHNSDDFTTEIQC